MFKLRPRDGKEPHRVNIKFPSNGGQQVASAFNARETPIVTQESNGGSSTSGTTTDAKPVEIVAQDKIHSVAFLADEEHIVSGGREMKIRQWRLKDGKEVLEKPRDAGSFIRDLAVTQDGKWIVCGTESGQVIVWDAKNREQMNVSKAHPWPVNVLDVSADGKKIATGGDSTLRVWSFLTGQQLLGPLNHDHYVLTVRFSSDGRHIATATWKRESVRIYDSSDGTLIADFPIQASLFFHGSLAWANDSSRLFALSRDGDIHCLDVSTKKTLAKWRIHSDNEPSCIALACNDTIVAASANSSLSFWDARTHQQIGSVVHHSHFIGSMAISPNYNIVTAGNKGITLWNLHDILPSPYCDNLFLEREIRRLKLEKDNTEDTVQSLRARNSCQMDDIANLEKTVQELRAQLAVSNKEKTDLKEMIKYLRAQNEASNRKIIHLDETGRAFHSVLVASQGLVGRLAQTTRALRADVNLPERSLGKMIELELCVQELGDRFATYKHALRVYDKKHECERLYADGRIYDAVHHMNSMSEDLRCNELVVDWLKGFTSRCISRLQKIGGEASSSKQHDEALSAYSTVLSLTPSPPEGVLMGWAKVALIRCSASEALGTIDKFKLAKFYAYQAVCNVLREEHRVMEAVECFLEMQNKLSEEASTIDERRQWELNFRRRYSEKLENEGDAAMDVKTRDAAIEFYSIALSLHPPNVSEIIVKCCKARVHLLEDELAHVTQITEHDPSNYEGYKRKHAVLHRLRRYKEAFNTFEMMLSRMENSLDPQVQKMRSCYLDTTPLIRQVVEQTIHDIPRALINTVTGRLYDKAMQAEAFEQLPVFNELRSLMTTRDRFDPARIQREVEKFYEYVMFSHKWQPSEPSFQMAEKTVIYGLPTSPTTDKLVNFCRLVQARRFQWAWSDTCCVNQSDKGVQQESVVSMFQWYRRAALTIVHLLGVLSESQEPGSLWKSIWNTRGWTYQEYVASKVIQFYTEDWKPYLGLEIYNHKESPIILAEMEQATMFATAALATLQPGLTRVREKLYLASKRQTTRKEDIAYCLFGIFDVALPVIYGEGTRAVHRLLEYILTRSGNVTLLSWTRAGNSISGSNSYLPSDLTVYDQIEPPHVPQPIETAEMDRMTMALQSSLPDTMLAVQLYERLYDLSPLSINAGRLCLPGFVFSLRSLTAITTKSGSESIVHVYHANTAILGDVRIQTQDNLIGMHGLILIHPWISPLLDRDFFGGAPQFDLAMRALRLVVGLKQPFGALLFASQERLLYKRVATDSFIKVQIREETPLEDLMDCMRTVNVQ